MMQLPQRGPTPCRSREGIWVQRHVLTPGTPTTGRSLAQFHWLMPLDPRRVTHRTCPHHSSLSNIAVPGSTPFSSRTDGGTTASTVSCCNSSESTGCHATPSSAYRSIRTCGEAANMSFDSETPSSIECLDEVRTGDRKARPSTGYLDAEVKAPNIENRLLKVRLQQVNAQLKRQQSMVLHLMHQLENERKRRCEMEDALLESCSCLGPDTS